MARRFFHTRAKFQATSLLAGDEPVNDFSWYTDGAPNFPGVHGAIVNFYNNSPGAHPVAHWIGRTLSRAAGTAQLDTTEVTGHLDGSAAGPPIAMANWTLGAPDAVQEFPRGLAIVLDMHGDLTAISEFGPVDATIPTGDEAVDEGAPATHSGRDRPRSRLRGRIFIPCPTLSSSVEDGATREVTVALVPTEDLAASASTLLNIDMPFVTSTWAVWSRRNAAMVPVVGGWVDNAYGSSRRRRLEEQGRLLWT